MMLQSSNLKQRVRSTSIPAPIGGLNAVDSIASMPPTDALILDNIFCEPSAISVRNGTTNWVTGIPAVVESLCAYKSATAGKLFAAAGTSIYDATAQGAVGAAVVTGLTNARFQHANIGSSGGQFLLMVNGADKLNGYNGTTWWKDGDGTHDITGVNTALCDYIHLFKNRIWLIEKNSFRGWYLGLNSIAGAATSFDFSPLFKLGGSLQVMATWTIENAQGIDDFAAFISSEGEVALYKGYDPNYAASWSLVGMFRIGRPIGKRCIAKLGSDIAIICADGVALLSKELTTERALNAALSYKIVNLINNDVQSYGNNFGWQIILYPIGNKLLINVPIVENTSQYQYVMNTITNAWSTWGKSNSALNASCWEILGDSIYYGTSGTVVRADTGYADNTNPIKWDIEPAFSYFDTAGQNKMFTMARPVFLADGALTASAALCTDFNTTTPNSAIVYRGGSSLWNSSPWNVTPWGGSTQIRKGWLTVNGIGYAAALRLNGSTANMSVKLQSIDYVFETGGTL